MPCWALTLTRPAALAHPIPPFLLYSLAIFRTWAFSGRQPQWHASDASDASDDVDDDAGDDDDGGGVHGHEIVSCCASNYSPTVRR